MWLLLPSPSILMVIVLIADVVPPGYGGVYVAFAILQAIFLLAAIERIRRQPHLQNCGKVAMPKWQKAILFLFIGYAVLLVFVGSLTSQ
ncbi:MAG: hypothetical protein IPJ12_03100 [Betaproteobacteria bacterium]|nr:hypothetical protein [Betaproteobacteria bacterium]